MTNYTFNKTINGKTGTATIQWIEENKWSVGHYGVFVQVPYQNAYWENAYVFNKAELDKAIESALCILDRALELCTTF